MWIWQQADWPSFIWDEKVIEPKLRDIRFHQGVLLGKMSSQPKDQKQSMLDTLLANIIHSSAIEGEKLNAFSVRSSLANKLGLSEEKPFPTTERTDGLAEIMLDAVENLDSPPSLERILQWHKRLSNFMKYLIGPPQTSDSIDDFETKDVEIHVLGEGSVRLIYRRLVMRDVPIIQKLRRQTNFELHEVPNIENKIESFDFYY